MKITFKRQYRKQGSGKLVYVYGISGTPEQLAEYQKIKGDKFVADSETKEPLFFTTRYIGKVGKIVPNKEKTDFHADTTELEKLANLSAQFGYEMAKAMMNNPNLDVEPES